MIPNFLIPFFRTNHAGETGAVFIYKGILKLSKDKDIISFSKRHLITEADHLRTIEKLLPKKYQSKLINLWKVMGFITGYIPSLMGKNFIYATIFAVESFVEKHYQEQIKILSGKKEYIELTNLIKKLMHDEVDHKEEALEKIQHFNIAHRIWGKLVEFGSILAVKISKII
tara:strand:+ start:649 stop:1161 length:513 start_codon:yes stop_codon:yes gene_type:complete